MAFKKTHNLSSDGRSQKKRPSAAGKKVAQGSRIGTISSSGETGTPRLDRSTFKKPRKAELREVESRRADLNASNTLSDSFQQSDPYASDISNDSSQKSASKVPDDSSQKNTSKVSGDSSQKKVLKRKPAKRKGLSRRFLIGSLAVVLVLAIGTGLLAWNQWFRYDDTADIQGTWVIDGTDQSITITDADIVMTPEVSYPYSLDTFQKTITFSFKQYNGSGSYAFSPERTTLVITETDADSGEKVSTKLVKQ